MVGFCFVTWTRTATGAGPQAGDQGRGTNVPDLPGTTLLQEAAPLSLLLQDFLFVTASQVDEDQGVIEQPVLHLPIQPGVSGEAWRVVDL